MCCVRVVVDPEALRRTIQYCPKKMPVMEAIPSEAVFYCRVVATLRKSLAQVGLCVQRWAVARTDLAASTTPPSRSDRSRRLVY